MGARGTDATASFAIELEDETSGAAESAASALSKLRGQIEGGNKELVAMQRAMKNLQGGAVVNVQQFKQLEAAITAKKNAIADAQGKYVGLGGSFSQTARAGRGFEARLAALNKQAQGMPGPLGALVSKFNALKGLVGGGGIALGLVAIAAGLTALVAATVAATSKLYAYGVAQADARRSELLRLEGLTKLRNWYGVAAGNAGELQEAIEKVSASSALGRDKVAQYAEQLYKMHLRGSNLESALEGVAIKASVQGEAQASMFANWAAGANLTGQSVQRLSDNVKSRLGGIAKRQMESLTVQAVKQKESFDALFGGLKIDAFVKAKKTVSDLLSQSTMSGRALKAMLTTIVQPLINTVTAAQPIIKRFFQGMIIGALHLGIGFLRVRLWLRQTFGGNDITRGIDKMTVALYAGKFAVGALAGALVFATGAMVVFAAPVLLAATAIWALINTGRLLYQLWQEIDWKGLGTSIWQGIVGGLESGANAVIEAVKGLGSSAATAFKAALGISSPSKAFLKFGLAIPAGVSHGVESGTPLVRRAVDTMVAVPRSPAPGRAADARVTPRIPARGAPERDADRKPLGGGSIDASVTINELHVHTNSDKPAAAALELRDVLANILEGVAIQLGERAAGAT